MVDVYYILNNKQANVENRKPKVTFSWIVKKGHSHSGSLSLTVTKFCNSRIQNMTGIETGVLRYVSIIWLV